MQGLAVKFCFIALTFHWLSKSPAVIDNFCYIHWAISNNGFRSDSLYEKKIGEDLVFNNALSKIFNNKHKSHV